MIKVSIIVPVYKVENYLVQCLDSIVKQTLEDIEILVVDEGDMDRCREIIDYYERVDPRVIGIHEHNGGYGASVNKGIERARGEYIGIVESDDWIEPEMFEELYSCAKRTGASVVKSPFYCYFTPRKQYVDTSRAFINQYVPEGKSFTIDEFPHLLAIHPSLWSGLYKTKEMQEKNVRCIAAKGSGYVDACFYVEIYTKMNSIAWLDKPFYHWRVTSENSSCNNWNYTEILKRWNKNVDIFQKDVVAFNKIAPYFMTKSYSSIFAHYKKEKTFTKKEYDDLVAYLNRYTEAQILAAPRLTEKQKEELLLCRNDYNAFYNILFPPKKVEKPAPKKPDPKKPVSKKKKLIRKIQRFSQKKRLWIVLFAAGIYSLLFGIALQNLYWMVNGKKALAILSSLCIVAAVFCALSIFGCVCIWGHKKIRTKR